MNATDDLDRRLIVATQAGLPLVPQPYHALAAQLGCTPEEVMARLNAMLERGTIRRIGAAQPLQAPSATRPTA